MDPLVCILGTIKEEMYPAPFHITIIRLLYVARKQIARLWLSPHSLTVKQWINQVNSLLMREKLTYQHRRAHRKFYFVWQPWLDTPGLAPSQFILDRLLQI